MMVMMMTMMMAVMKMMMLTAAGNVAVRGSRHVAPQGRVRRVRQRYRRRRHEVLLLGATHR